MHANRWTRWLAIPCEIERGSFFDWNMLDGLQHGRSFCLIDRGGLNRVISEAMKKLETVLSLATSVLLSSMGAYAGCSNVSGKVSETIISPYALNDPFGRT